MLPCRALAQDREAGDPLLEAEEDQGTGLMSDSIPLSMFSCPGAAGFKVRGPKYLQDKKKVVLSGSFISPALSYMSSCFIRGAISFHDVVLVRLIASTGSGTIPVTESLSTGAYI